MGIDCDRFKLLTEEFREVGRYIRALESCFNQAVDWEIIEYYIMRLKAEEAKREYIWRQLREIQFSKGRDMITMEN